MEQDKGEKNPNKQSSYCTRKSRKEISIKEQEKFDLHVLAFQHSCLLPPRNGKARKGETGATRV
ncbi:hypothetical protein RJ641_022318 [Dillenia turbinata]|uniref:Uncharacterized protein n=1 Tax=Dillenia turbinata TaxID=194707 RepID=A0AAN8UMA1_9MAGN